MVMHSQGFYSELVVYEPESVIECSRKIDCAWRFIAHRKVQKGIRLSTYIRIAFVLGCCLLFRCSIHDVRTSLMFVQNFVGPHQCISYPSNTSWDKAGLDNSSCTELTMQQQPALFLRMPEPNSLSDNPGTTIVSFIEWLQSTCSPKMQSFLDP